MKTMLSFIRLVIAGGKTAMAIQLREPTTQILTAREIEYRENRDRGLVIPIIFPPPLYDQEAQSSRQSFQAFCAASDLQIISELKASGKL